MSRPGYRGTKVRHGERIATHRGQLSLIALAAGLLASVVLVVVQRQPLRNLVHAFRAPHAHIGLADILLIARFCAIPLATGVAAYLLADQTVRLLRVIIYLRSLHSYAARVLRTHDPLHPLGYEVALHSTHSDNRPKSDRSHSPQDLGMVEKRTLVIGAEGSGKSDALWAMVYERSRRRQWLSTFIGSAPLPIVASLTAYAEAQGEQDEPWIAYIVRQARVFGSAGFAARLQRRLTKRPALLVCDDLDALGPRLLRRWLEEIESLDTSSKRSHHIVTSVSQRHYLDEPAQYAVLRRFAAVEVQPVSQRDVTAVLRRARLADTRRGKPTLSEALRSHRLNLSLTSPAHLAALAGLRPSAGDMPYGRAQLWNDALTPHTQPTTASEVDSEEMFSALGQIASALVRANTRVISILPGRSLGRAVAEWLSANPPLFPLEVQTSESRELSPEQIEIQCRKALHMGLLVRSPDGACVRFAHRVLHAALAGLWLRSVDDGIGRVNAEILQEQWISPVLYWSGALPAPGDLATRIARLADTPDATAIRADLAAREDVLPTALALAFVVAVEGIACQLARARDTDAAYERTIPIAEHYLRDLLDRAAIYISEPEQQERLGVALRSAWSAGGPEIVAAAAELINTSVFGRLARAQLISILGVLATPDAIAACVDLLADTDPVIRQAVNQAMTFAGPAALEPLRHALMHPNEHVRIRAGEALALLGDVAFDTAVSALHGTDARQRAAAVRTISVLGASQVVDEVIARLDDQDGSVRIAAARALGQVATPDAVRALAQHITNTDPALRAAVAKALGASRDPNSLTPLLALLQDQDAQVRAASAAALGVLGDERAANALRQRREDADALAQHAALAALRRLGQTA